LAAKTIAADQDFSPARKSSIGVQLPRLFGLSFPTVLRSAAALAAVLGCWSQVQILSPRFKSQTARRIELRLAVSRLTVMVSDAIAISEPDFKQSIEVGDLAR